MNLNGYVRAATLAVVCVAVGFAVGRNSKVPEQPGPHALAAPAAPADSYQFFDTLVDLRSQILHNYVEKVDDAKLMNGAIKGMMAELDPYTNYFTKDELAKFDRAVHGQFSGVGAEIGQDPATGNFIIVSPLEDSPALKAGVYAGDRILKINGEAVDGLSLTELLTKVSGEPNTQLKLTLVHEGEKTPVEATITRAVIQVHSVRGVKHGAEGAWDFLIDPEHRIAYVRISNFMQTTAAELDEALLPLLNDNAAGGLKGIIVDLRFDPGGELQAAIEVSRRFLDSGIIVTAGKPEGSHKEFVAEANGEKTYPRAPLVVLINEYSASASEIVAGAMKDHRRAVLIGARSFGKGSVQSLINLDNGNAALKLTTQYYYLPSGKNIMRKKDSTEWGVEPDAAFNIPLTDEENRAVLVARSQSEIIHKAIGKPAATAPATQPNDDAAASAPAANVPAMAAVPASARAGDPVTSAAAATQKGEPADRQLQRALEILIAYQAFGPSKDFAADVTTARPGVSASIPASQTVPSPESNQAQPQSPDLPR